MMTIDALMRGKVKRTQQIALAINDLTAHSRKVGLMTTAFASELGMPQDEANHLGLCAVFHDVGKLIVPVDILLKPGKLTEQEYSIIKGHPLTGSKILLDIFGNDAMMSRVALQHHERYHQHGYPMRLEAAPIDTQIVAACDCLEAMTSQRPYKDAMDFQTAYNMVSREACGPFHPDVMIGLCSDAVYSRLRAVYLGLERPSKEWLRSLDTYTQSFIKGYSDREE